MKVQHNHTLNLSARECHKSKSTKAKSTIEVTATNKAHFAAKTIVNIIENDASTSHSVP